ncbi:helix-turn-helix domain-containing protein [Rhodococcus sp. IEGM 1379]|uniref:sigma-54-dependent Fis family transcriptional regulator n=1 Tax=Rhodococcus sp. IEGM 1379 TaxID=3047086 RepID=UPI0024B8704A|nr:helix-turn-helix domain-containing protein [Rhodococcus sp. IEGM 1379]MDI9916060.1 helix-turn-helix domain-containing protein [Rhodococcus sp. IEGM 1379]
MCGLEPGSTPSTTVRIIDDLGNSSLLRAAGPVLDEVADQIRDTDTAVVLADRDCMLVHRVIDDGAIGMALDHSGLAVGTYFGEDVMGTNGVGTAAELRRGLSIIGNEHFLDVFKQFSCYGQPIFHPATNRIEGVLNIIGFAKAATPMFAAFVQRVVSDIERRLLEGTCDTELRLVAEFQRITRLEGGAVCALGDGFVLGNTPAQKILETADVGVLRRLAAEVRRDAPLSTRLQIDNGREMEITIETVPGAGVICRIEPLWVKEQPVLRRAPTQQPSGYVWGPRLKALRQTPGSVSITGEAGTGRSTAARELAKPNTCAVFDAADISIKGERDWTASLVEHAAMLRGVLIVENVELLPSTQLAVLGRVLASPQTIPRVVVTSTAQVADDRLEPVLSRCAYRADLSPLRERVGDFAALVDALTMDLVGSNRIRYSASAMHALSTQLWPGNLAELRTVLARTLTGRTGGTIGSADLPESHRYGVHTALLGRDRAERVAIVEALRASSGNKVHAAGALGISRTTLYRRMRALNVPG